jgi:hypothetical protein
MEATVVSDAVNTASRIEEMTKIYGASLLISDETFRSLKDHRKYHLRKIDRVNVKGKTQSTTIWEVFDCDPLELLSHKVDTGAIFEEAISLYQSKQYEDAFDLFSDCLAKNPKDKAAEVYRDRCKLYMKVGADENMQGIVRRVIYERIS